MSDNAAMGRIACHAICLDASALVKLYVKEEGSDKIRDYVSRKGPWYTTLFCYFEALGVLCPSGKAA